MIFTPIAGGLGDVLSYYLEGELGYFRALRSAGVRTKVVVWSVSDQVESLFQFNPHVSVLDVRPFAAVDGMTTGFRNYAQNLEPDFKLMTDAQHAATPWARPSFYFSPEEAVAARDIANAEPYVAIHPFAGRPERSLARVGIARQVVSAAAKWGRVVVLGGNSHRRNGGVSLDLREGFDFEHPNVINLVNKFSVPLQAHVASRATKFIGSISCYNCVAQACGVPALVFGSTANRKDMASGGSVFKKMRDNGTPVHYLDRRPDVSEIVRGFLK